MFKASNQISRQYVGILVLHHYFPYVLQGDAAGCAPTCGQSGAHCTALRMEFPAGIEPKLVPLEPSEGCYSKKLVKHGENLPRSAKQNPKNSHHHQPPTGSTGSAQLVSRLISRPVVSGPSSLWTTWTTWPASRPASHQARSTASRRKPS